MNKKIGDNIDIKSNLNLHVIDSDDICDKKINSNINTVPSESLEEESIINEDDNTNKPIAIVDTQVTSNATKNNHILGKFDSVEALSEAYQSLQAEFTRKSQELADLKRESNDKINFNTTDLLKDLKSFADDTGNDNQFIEEVSQKLINNDNLINDKLGLTYAIYGVMKDKIETKLKDFQSDNNIYNLVSKSDTVKDKIINEYINDCNSGKVPPLIMDTFGSNIMASSPKKPTTLEEAASIMNKWLDK